MWLLVHVFCRLMVSASDVVWDSERLHCKNLMQWFSKWGVGTSEGPLTTFWEVPNKNEEHLEFVIII